MRRQVSLIVVIIILLLASSTATAQQQLNPGDAFRYFPDGAYRSFEACSVETMREAEAYSVYLQIAGGRSENVLPDIAQSLPEQFAELADFYAFAQALRIEVPEGKEMAAVDGDMLVLSIPGLSALIEQEVNEKRLTPTGRRLMKRPIYSLTGGGRESCFAFATVTDELLLARDPKMIRAMIRADTGRSLRMIDNQEYADLLGYLGDLGQLLMVRSIRASLQPTLQSSPDEVGAEAIAKAEAAGELIFEIENIFVSDEIIMIKHAVFTNEEAARSHYATLRNPYAQQEASEENPAGTGQRQQRMPNSPTTVFELMMENRRAEYEGTTVTTTIHLRADDLRKAVKISSGSVSKDETEDR